MEKLRVAEDVTFLLPIRQKTACTDFETGQYLKNLFLSISSLCPNNNLSQEDIKIMKESEPNFSTFSIYDDQKEFLEEAWFQDYKTSMEDTPQQTTSDTNGGSSPGSIFSDNNKASSSYQNDGFLLSDTEPEDSPKSTKTSRKREPKASHINKESKKIQKERNKKSDKKEEKKGKSRARRDLWQPEEDSLLLELFTQHGPKWTMIGSIIGQRTGKQVRDRYLNSLRPNIKNDEWTTEEDKLLVCLYRDLGNKWCQIAKFLPGRTENQVKNRFYAHKRWYQNGLLPQRHSPDTPSEQGDQKEKKNKAKN